ncbi:hypothetical protein BGX21_010337 [Mortierella sp. AD011]|nr:hypothetical protein BGX21_010337 [Mortierella sp. AD011]
MKSTTCETKNSNSFEVVSIDDRTHVETLTGVEKTSPRDLGYWSISPKGRLIALAAYLLAGTDNIKLCDNVASCLFYSTQGWPAMGEQTIDLLVMSYISGTISVVGGVLGAFGIYAAYKESASKVRLFARAWWFMIGIFIGSTVLTLFLTVVHKQRFLDQCYVEHDSLLGTSDCGTMYAAALLGSLIGCLIGVTMILCYCGDVVKYSVELENVKQKTQRTDGAL